VQQKKVKDDSAFFKTFVHPSSKLKKNVQGLTTAVTGRRQHIARHF
jgi:hypothetical protein